MMILASQATAAQCAKFSSSGFPINPRAALCILYRPGLHAIPQRLLLRNPLRRSEAANLYGVSDEAQSIANIHAALDAGINLLDPGDFWFGPQRSLDQSRAQGAAPGMV